MKRLFCVLTVLLATLSGTLSLSAQTRQTVAARQAYIEPFSASSREDVSVRRGGITNWNNQNLSVVWYLYQEKGSYELSIDLQKRSGEQNTIEMNCTQCSELGFKPMTKKVSLKAAAGDQQVKAGNVEIPATGYYRYEMKALTGMKGVTIAGLSFNTTADKATGAIPVVHATKFQSSPSVHLSFSTTAPTTKEYDWIYEEIMVPKGYDPLHTYWMSLGFFRGYMGIQTNSETERRVLFSVWDSVDTDKNPNASKDSLVSLVDKADDVTSNGFGNEGTGGQSYVKSANWKVDHPVKFLMNVRRGEGSIVLSAWYCLNDTEGWKYVASWRAPQEQRLFNGFYSFIENFSSSNGQLLRKGYYFNAFGREASTGKWLSFNKVRFSHTDGAEGERMDYEQGVAPEYPTRFYMASGGYTPTKLTADEIPLQTNAPAMDLKPFIERVDQALRNEKK